MKKYYYQVSGKDGFYPLPLYYCHCESVADAKLSFLVKTEATKINWVLRICKDQYLKNIQL